MGLASRYTAAHDESGEEYKGTADEVARRLGVAASTIYKAQIEGKKVGGHWNITKEERKKKTRQERRFTNALVDEWDALASAARAGK